MILETPKGATELLKGYIRQLNDPNIVTTAHDFNVYSERYRTLLVAVLVRLLMQSQAENTEYLCRMYDLWESGKAMCFIRSNCTNPKTNVIVMEYQLGYVLYQFNNTGFDWEFKTKEYIQKGGKHGTAYFIN